MDLIAKVAIAAVIIVVLVYLGVVLMFWRDLKNVRVRYQKCVRELEQLKLARDSTETAIGLARDNMKICDADGRHFQEKKLADLQKALEKNGRKTVEIQEQMEKHRIEIAMGEEALRKLRNFSWLKIMKR